LKRDPLFLTLYTYYGSPLSFSLLPEWLVGCLIRAESPTI